MSYTSGAMNRALTLYEDLKNNFEYLCHSWLKVKPEPATEKDAIVILDRKSVV